jgi:hypothetical protein
MELVRYLLTGHKYLRLVGAAARDDGTGQPGDPLGKPR